MDHHLRSNFAPNCCNMVPNQYTSTLIKPKARPIPVYTASPSAYYQLDCKLTTKLELIIPQLVNDEVYTFTYNLLLEELRSKDVNIFIGNYISKLNADDPDRELALMIWCLRSLDPNYAHEVSTDFHNSPYLAELIKHSPYLQIFWIGALLASGEYEPAQSWLAQLSATTNPILAMHYHAYQFIYNIHQQQPNQASFHLKILITNSYCANNIPRTVKQRLSNFMLNLWNSHYERTLEENHATPTYDFDNLLTNDLVDDKHNKLPDNHPLSIAQLRAKISTLLIQKNSNMAAEHAKKYLYILSNHYGAQSWYLFHHCLEMVQLFLDYKDPVPANDFIKMAETICSHNQTENRYAKIMLTYHNVSIAEANTDADLIPQLKEYINLFSDENYYSQRHLKALFLLCGAYQEAGDLKQAFKTVNSIPINQLNTLDKASYYLELAKLALAQNNQAKVESHLRSSKQIIFQISINTPGVFEIAYDIIRCYYYLDQIKAAQQVIDYINPNKLNINNNFYFLELAILAFEHEDYTAMIYNLATNIRLNEQKYGIIPNTTSQLVYKFCDHFHAHQSWDVISVCLQLLDVNKLNIENQIQYYLIHTRLEIALKDYPTAYHHLVQIILLHDTNLKQK